MATHPNSSEENNKITPHIDEEDIQVAMKLVGGTLLSTTDAVRLVMELLEEGEESEQATREAQLKYSRQVIRMGIEAHRLSRKTVTLQKGMEELLRAKAEMRERTKGELRNVCTRLLDCTKSYKTARMRSMTMEDCKRLIENAFETIPTRKKARLILHSVFANAIRNGWCSENPVKGIVFPRHKEKPIHSLSIDEIVRLLSTAERPEHKLCAPALGIMLWGGVRPHEIEQLRVENIDFEDKVITVPAQHAKTGGARQVTMHPVLASWLRRMLTYTYPSAPIAPPSWHARWVKLRHDAGFTRWEPDVLRHTFASYHLKYFKNILTLQIEMGHANTNLLRTRYLAMENVTSAGAKIFWNYKLQRSRKTPAEGTP